MALRFLRVTKVNYLDLSFLQGKALSEGNKAQDMLTTCLEGLLGFGSSSRCHGKIEGLT
jgi:hypothetical protein